MNEDEQKQLETGASGATMTPPAPSVQPPPPPTGVGVDAFDAAESAATTAPGQSVVDAARNAETESQLRGVAQAVTAADRYKATQSGMESPPSAWAQDVNDLYAGLTRAAQRSAERLAQPQQGQETQQNQQQAPMQPDSTPDDPFAISAPKQSPASQPVQKSGKMVFGAQQNFASAAQDRANEFVGGYFA